MITVDSKACGIIGYWRSTARGFAREGNLARRKSARTDVVAVLRRIVLVALAVVLVWAAAVVVLTLLYTAVPPVSTLMVGRWLTGGTVAREAVGMDAISPHLPLAVIASEDNRFCLHHGVDWGALRAVVRDASDDGPSRGASTIPMQTAKNLFLWPSRSYLRKALEIPVALFIDLVWSKRRLMDNYLNVAEWGDGIFGAEAAAQHYFRKPASALTRREAALLAVALPNPYLRNPARPTGRLRALAGRLLARMNRVEPLTRCVRP